MLEKLAQPKPTIVEVADHADEPEPVKPRASRTRSASSKKSPAVKPRTIYLPENLFERIMVQAHRKGLTISDYVTNLLNRHVPDYRTASADSSVDDAA